MTDRLSFQVSSVDVANYDFGSITPGESGEVELTVKNNHTASVDDIAMRIFPEKTSWSIKSKYNVFSAEIIRETANRVLQKTSILKEDCPALTEKQERFYCLSSTDGGVTFTDESESATINFPGDSNTYIYFGSDVKLPAYYHGFDTPGSYDGYAIKIYDGAEWAAFNGSDGTSGATQNGYITFPEADLDVWAKVSLNDINVYWYRVEVSAVTTQAVANAAYWAWVYDLPYPMIVDTGDYYEKTDDEPPAYPPLTPDVEYPNWGMIAFEEDPLSDPSHFLVCEIDYKNPTPGLWEIQYISEYICQVRFNEGDWSDNIAITADGSTVHTSVIPGMYVIFIPVASIDTSKVDQIEISEGCKYYWIEDANKDYSVGTLTAGGTSDVTFEYRPPASGTTATNSNACNILLHKAA